MGQSLSKVYVHIVFSTRKRIPLIDRKIEKRLFEYIGGLCRQIGCTPLRVGGYRNHVHILCKLSKNASQSQLVREVKHQSSKWIKMQGDEYRNFYWQGGYAMFSVNPMQVDRVATYIDNQEPHHQSEKFQNELRRLLKKFKIEFDERYIWD